jgi:hypothetical protein
MTGSQLAGHIRGFDSITPIIIASGNLLALGQAENAYFLRKPYRILDIKALINKTQDKSSNSGKDQATSGD